MPKVRSGIIVTVLTSAALSAVGMLAWQAEAAQHAAARADAAHAHQQHGATPAQEAAARARELPAASGTGRRVVYALGRHRVWLVTAKGTVARTYQVVPGTVDPAPGTYTVTTGDREAQVTGTDGTPVEHVVLFDTAKQPVIGFSEAVDGSLPTPDPAKRTGGIREHTADGDAMWAFAVTGTTVVVVH